MGKRKPGHYITPAAKLRFQTWLLKNKLSMTQFAKQAGCSRQYLTKVLDGERSVTTSVREWFKKGGYELSEILWEATESQG